MVVILFFKKEIFKYINQGEELVIEPFQRLIAKQQLFCLQIYWLFWGYGYFQRKATVR